MNKIILLSFLWLICFTNNAIHAENSFKTYFGKVYSIGDTITIGRNNGYIYEFDNSQTRTIKQDLSGKKLTISQFYNIKKVKYTTTNALTLRHEQQRRYHRQRKWKILSDRS